MKTENCPWFQKRAEILGKESRNVNQVTVRTRKVVIMTLH